MASTQPTENTPAKSDEPMTKRPKRTTDEPSTEANIDHDKSEDTMGFKHHKIVIFRNMASISRRVALMWSLLATAEEELSHAPEIQESTKQMLLLVVREHEQITKKIVSALESNFLVDDSDEEDEDEDKE